MHAGTRTPPASLRRCAERRDCRQRIAPHPLPLQVAAAEALAFAQKHNCKYFEAVALSNEQARRQPLVHHGDLLVHTNAGPDLIVTQHQKKTT